MNLLVMRMLRKARHGMRELLRCDRLRNLERSVVELNNTAELKKIFGWNLDPLLDDDSIFMVESSEDANERRVRDAESLGIVVRNTNPAICLDIGTSTGHSAALMAVNAPQSMVHTVNIPPEDLDAGKGGKNTTVRLSRQEIGAYYRERGLTNIEQILADTATWQPEVGAIDVAFIDGCHDVDFVFNDTRKVLEHVKSGGFILWHDFNPALTKQHTWIREVCLAVERLYAHSLLTGNVFHVRDSWTGIYRVPEKMV
jgi:predicted O-methyltransferase YrrM